MTVNGEHPTFGQWIGNMAEGTAPPRKNGELNFQEPWESRAFGMVIALYNEKRYTSWDAFRTRLIEQIAEWESENNNKEHCVWNYYEHWLSALERLLIETHALDLGEIEARTQEFLSGKREEVY